jgi:FAD linked oxidases, C-terminal domain
VVASFPTTQSAVEAVMLTSGTLRPAMLEFMDRTTVNAVEDWLKMGLDRQAAAVLVAQTDAEGAASGRELAAIVSAFQAAGASEVFATDDPAEGDQFVAARRQAIPAVERRGRLLLEDVGVPLPKLIDLLAGIERIASEHGLTIALIAHAGDGNTHPLIVFDPAVPELARQAEIAFGEIMDLAIELGGTITGEHGVGRLKQPWLASQLGPDALALTHRIKQAIDPSGILNPGVILLPDGRAPGRLGPEPGRVETGPAVPAPVEPCPGEQGHHGLGEQEHDEDVDQGGQAEGVGEPLDVARREMVEHRRREERDRVRHQDGAPGALPAALRGRAQRLAVADRVPEPFEVHDERVRRDADGHDEAGDSRQ